MQWAIALGRIDIMYATIFLPQYRPDPHKGHLKKIQHLYGYLKTYTSTYTKFNTEMPAYENFKIIGGNRGNLHAW